MLTKGIGFGLVLMVAGLWQTAIAQSEFLAWLYSNDPSYPHTEAYDLTARGEIVVGAMYTQNGDPQPVRWVQGMVQLLPLPWGAVGGEAKAISEDGTTIVGVAYYPPGSFIQARPVRWVGYFDVEVEELPVPPGSIGGTAYGVNRDGSVVVGGYGYPSNYLPRARAFRWTNNGGLQLLGTLGGDYSVAFDVSSDGNRVVGLAHDAQNEGHGFLWQPTTGMLPLPLSIARGISPEGNVIVGEAGSGPARMLNNWPRPSMFPLAMPSNASSGVAEDASSCGYYIVGSVWIQDMLTYQAAARWSRRRFENLNEVYASLLEPGEILLTANAITPDGGCVAGVGWSQRGYVARRAGYVICKYARQRLGDVNYDEIVDDADLLIVLLNFGTDSDEGDTNADGVVDDADLLIVLLDFGAGD